MVVARQEKGEKADTFGQGSCLMQTVLSEGEDEPPCRCLHALQLVVFVQTLL